MRPSVRHVVVAIVAIAVFVYVPKALWPESWFFTNVLTPKILLSAGALAKLLCLGAGAYYGMRSAAALETTNPARTAWRLIGGWLTLWTGGELMLMGHAYFMNQLAPAGSFADGAFLVGYVFMLAALVRFVFVYRQSGFPIGSATQHAAMAGISTVILGVFAYVLLAPIARADASFSERFVNVSYPVADLAALVPTILLIRIALAFRPGRVWTVWASLLTGFVLMFIGDTVAAYLWPAEFTPFDAWVHLTYLLGYFFTALGTKLAYDLFTE